MEKTKDPSRKKEESTTTGKPVAEIDSPEKSNHDAPADMNEDELAASNKIMGDIDNQEEKQLNGTPTDPGPGESDENELSKEEPETLNEDIDATNSESPTGVHISDSAHDEAVDSEEGGDESLDEDQQRAFESIMAQIESGGLVDASSGEEPGDASESEPADDVTAELEKMVKEADADVDAGAADSQRVELTDSDGLDPDQQQALESITAQTQGDGGADTDSGKETDETSESEPADDFTAELEKVVKEADMDDDARAADSQRAELTDDEGLDPDQQQALESIMAQIQGDDTADADTRSVQNTGDEPESENVDGLSAELEKVIQETAPDEHDDIQDAESEEPDDTLSGNQQQAFESIMAQIEGGDTKQKDPVPSKSESAEPKSEGTSEDQEQPTVEPTEDKTDDDSHDLSPDIEDILTEIASSDDESHLPEATSVDSGAEPVTVEASDQSMVDDDIVAHEIADSGLEQAGQPQTSTPAVENEGASDPDERPLTKDPSGDPRFEKKPTPARLTDPQKAEPLREAAKTAVGRQKKVLLASIVAILFLVLAGYFYLVPQNMTASKIVVSDTETRPRDAAVEAQSALQIQQPVAVVHGPSDQSRLKTAAENLDRLRNELVAKQTEIGELRAYYQAGIDAEIQAIADRVREAGNGKIQLPSAIADPSISLGLSAIQRRDAYIKKLETPVSILDKSSEELLFFSRKAALLALMAGKTSDIDIDGFIKQADEVRNIHGSELAQLNIDTVPASSRTLESIWQDVEKRLSTIPVKTKDENRVTDTDNAAIWKNICDGDFSQKHKLTALSSEAARCLTRWKGKDLFLNALTDLPPDAARNLSAWEGDWLGLNGLRELSPEAAVHLSRWKGTGLSLNSLSRLSPQVVAILSDWQGDQIELINVKHMAHWENPKTRLFLSEDLKRKLSATRK